MSRVVFDTNIYISALMFGGLPGALLELALLRSFVLIASDALLDELDEKLRIKFGVSVAEADFLRAKLEDVAQVVRPRETLNAIADDSDDNRVLECAVAGSANLIVSGDRHLLKLSRYEGIASVPPRQFIDSLDATRPD